MIKEVVIQVDHYPLIPRSRLEPPNKLTTVFLPWFKKSLMVRNGQVFGRSKRPFRMRKLVSKPLKHQEMFGRPDGKSECSWGPVRANDVRQDHLLDRCCLYDVFSGNIWAVDVYVNVQCSFFRVLQF